jgi:hypothetical protein
MSDALPAEFWQGIDEFNRGEFYACHDTLEAIWIPAIGSEKSLYQGIIQIAVAIYHLSNLNWRGAVILMGEGLNRLRHYPDEYAGLDLGGFRADVAELLTTLQNLGPERVGDFVWQSAAVPLEATESPHTISHPRPLLQKVIAP